jgi:hypothetical protein
MQALVATTAREKATVRISAFRSLISLSRPSKTFPHRLPRVYRRSALTRVAPASRFVAIRLAVLIDAAPGTPHVQKEPTKPSIS